MKQIVLESKLESKGHYVPGVAAGGMVYVSGQLPVHHDTGAPMAAGIAQQTRDALSNVERVLRAAGCARQSVVMCRVYIPDMAHWDTVNAVYAEFFGSHRPARVVVPTRALHNGALVEIEAIAEIQTAGE